jgi:hypothetical protein
MTQKKSSKTPVTRKAPKGQAKNFQGMTKIGLDKTFWISKKNEKNDVWVWRRVKEEPKPMNKKLAKDFRTKNYNEKSEIVRMLNMHHPVKNVKELQDRHYKQTCHLNSKFRCARGFGPGEDLCEYNVDKNRCKLITPSNQKQVRKMKERNLALKDPMYLEYLKRYNASLADKS